MKVKRQHPRPGGGAVTLLRMAAVFCWLTVSLAPGLAQAGPAVKDPVRPAARSNPVVSELEALSESAQEIFDLAWAGKLDKIPKRLDALKKNAAGLSSLQDQSSGILLPRLGRTIVDLDQALAAKDRVETMRYANRITLITATIAVAFKPNLPTEVSLLDYNGRELAITSEMKKNDKLASIVMRMHLAWQTLMPKLIERNGLKELRRFSDTMGRLELAKTPEEYSRLSRQVTAELDAIKQLFSKSSR